MMYINSFVYFILICQTICGTRDPHKLTAVSGAPIAEALYRRVRAQNPNVERPPPMDPNTKSRICHHITSGILFNAVIEEEPVYVHQMYSELRDTKLVVFANLYEAHTTTGYDIHLIYTNPTNLIEVYVQPTDRNSMLEYAFICLTYDRRSEENEDDEDNKVDDDNVSVHYVSSEYNLSDIPSTYIAGRFLFHDFGVKAEDIMVTIVAEEPATSLSAPGAHVERAYLQRRAQNQPGENRASDPVCTLNQNARLRVCTLILSSTHFKGELEFIPSQEYVDDIDCTKREISFQDDQVKSETSETLYEEWMISCRVARYYAGYQSEYYLSRVYDSEDKVFAYRRNQDSKIVLENLFENVRFKI